MINYVLLALLLYFIYIAVSGVMRVTSSKGESSLLVTALGTRDAVTEGSVGSHRCSRAQRNMEESLFFFLPIAVLLMVTGKADGLGLTGALVFVVARALYLPAYLSGVFAARSIIWTIAAAGIVMMAIRLMS